MLHHLCLREDLTLGNLLDCCLWIARRCTDAFQGLWSWLVGPVVWLMAVPSSGDTLDHEEVCEGPAGQQSLP